MMAALDQNNHTIGDRGLALALYFYHNGFVLLPLRPFTITTVAF